MRTLKFFFVLLAVIGIWTLGVTLSFGEKIYEEIKVFEEISLQEEQKQKDIKSERCWLFTARISSQTDPRFFTNTTAKRIYNECNR